MGASASAPLTIPGGDGVGGAAKEAFADTLAPIAAVGAFRNLKKPFALFAEMDFNVHFLIVAADAQTQHVTRLLLVEPATLMARRFAVIPAHNFIADKETTLRSGAVGIHDADGPGAVGVAFRGEA